MLIFYDFTLDLQTISDPDLKHQIMDPAKSFGFLRIRIHNTGSTNSFRFHITNMLRLCAMRHIAEFLP
jgi:hypothetical protein